MAVRHQVHAPEKGCSQQILPEQLLEHVRRQGVPRYSVCHCREDPVQLPSRGLPVGMIARNVLAQIH